MSRSAISVSEGLKKVPPFPPIAAKLLRLLTSPEVDLGEVAELISNDSTFTARLLQRANSVEFGFLSPIAGVKQAVALLGADLTRHVVLSQATAAYAQRALRAEELQRCWQHTIATGVLAEEIASACHLYAEGAFAAGIMHDIGRLGLLVAYPEDYERIIRDAAERSVDLLDFEHDEFGLDHAEAGRMLAERWGLPAEICMIAGRHHDPAEGSELNLLRIIHVACRLADVFGYEVSKPLVPLTVETVLEELPARARQLGDLVALRVRIEKRIAEYSSRQASLPPEETLAMLAPVVPEPDGSTEPSAAVEAEASPDQAPERSHFVSPALIAAIALFVVALVVFVLWRLR